MVFLESEADAPLKLAHRGELLLCPGLEHHRENQLRAFQCVDAEDLRIGDEDVLELGGIADFDGDGSQDLKHLVGIRGEVTLMLMVATEKSALWLATVVIWELGTTYRVPSPPRTVALRRVIDSTVPVRPATVITSPTLN